MNPPPQGRWDPEEDVRQVLGAGEEGAGASAGGRCTAHSETATLTLVLDCQETLPLPQTYPLRQFLMEVLQERVIQL